MAEYEALLHGMRAAKEMKVNRLRCYGDSDLVAGQVAGTCDSVSPTMAAYRQVVDKLDGHFAGYSVEWIDRRKNEEDNTLSRIGSDRLAPPAGVFLDTITKPSVSTPREIDIGVPLQPEAALVALIAEPEDWTRPYMANLEGGTLPADETDARMITRRCKSFVIIDGLHKRSM